MDLDGYPPKLVGCGWMWMDVVGYPFPSIYQKALYGFPRGFSDHV